VSALGRTTSEVAAGGAIASTRLTGTAAAPGFAIGPIWRYRAADASSRGGSKATTLSIAEAATIAATDLQALAERVRVGGRTAEAEIFEAQALMAADPMIVEAASVLAEEHGATDASALADAVADAAASVAEMFAGIEDELLAARAADVRDVGARIGRVLLGLTIDPPSRPSIAVADDLPPSVTVDLPAGSLIGIALESGTRTSHAAILARGLGIPAVVGVSGLLAAIEAEATVADPGRRDADVAVDGDTGLVILRPDEHDAAVMRERIRASSVAASAGQALRGKPGATRDGHPVPLLANIGRPEDAGPALVAGAEGVGLFRTEFVFMGRSGAPTEDEQVRAYADVLGQFGRDRPVVIRLADIGGDKAIPYLGLPPEANPFLGVRGLRLAYEVARPLLVTQIRAIARAGAVSGTVPHLMAPMVATLEDVELILELRAEAFAALDREGTERAERIVTGIMVEVPSAALIADRLAPHVDFFSIGSNDLTQYTLAADRTNAKLGSLQDALHPAVLTAIASTVRGADGAGIPVAVCGELASDPAGALVLVGLGVDELSMEATALDPVRLRLSQHPLAELEGLAREALAAPSAGAVRDLVSTRIGD
jgi:phosphoenolpyruvate-protein phosphotransferase